MKTENLPLKLAFRVEGGWWIARVMTNTNEYQLDGHELGRIRVSVCVESDDVKQAFFKLMQDAFTVAAKGALGVDVTWPNDPVPAPESERSGNA